MNINDFNDTEKWASQQWGKAELGDARRNQRAVQMGQALANNPEASLPEQMGSWGDLKAAYRLLNQEDVTHKALSQPHCTLTRQQAALTEAEVVLFVQDTTELDYTRQVKTQNLGHIGDGKGRGLMLHSCLAVVPQPGNPEIIGLAAQAVWRREQIKRGSETRTQRASRRTESDLWAEIVEAIGVAPHSSETSKIWVSVGDRGSDVFSYIRRATAINWNCLIRVCQDRVIHTADGVKGHLLNFVRSIPVMARAKVSSCEVVMVNLSEVSSYELLGRKC